MVARLTVQPCAILLSQVRRFVGIKAVAVAGEMAVEKAVGRMNHLSMVRGETVESMLRAVNEAFDLPDVELMMVLADHLDQVAKP